MTLEAFLLIFVIQAFSGAFLLPLTWKVDGHIRQLTCLLGSFQRLKIILWEKIKVQTCHWLHDLLQKLASKEQVYAILANSLQNMPNTAYLHFNRHIVFFWICRLPVCQSYIFEKQGKWNICLISNLWNIQPACIDKHLKTFLWTSELCAWYHPNPASYEWIGKFNLRLDRGSGGERTGVDCSENWHQSETIWAELFQMCPTHRPWLDWGMVMMAEAYYREAKHSEVS